MGRATTPMMEQYFRIKEQYTDCLLLFRLGDFYEMFGEDAIVGSKALEITLTSRDKGKKEKTPLCGIPWHALDSYLPKLLSKGYKVAICEQMEDAKYAKGLVDRDVVRVVTPGTVLESSLLDSSVNNYLMSICRSNAIFGMSFVDISTGEFLVTQIDSQDAESRVMTEFVQRAPKEILFREGDLSPAMVQEFSLSETTMTRLDDFAFMKESSEPLLKRHFKLQSLEGIGLADRDAAVSSAGAILRYLENTQKRSLDFLSRPKYIETSEKLILDQTTLRNLEVARNVRDGKQAGTLFSVLDRTLTPMGSRLLRNWIMEPLLDVESVNLRLDAVQELATDTIVRTDLASSLKHVRDLERLISKTMHGSANARDLIAIKDCVAILPELREALSGCDASLLAELGRALEFSDDIPSLIERAIADDPPLMLKDGGLIKDGYDETLDELRASARGGKKWIASLEETERARTGIRTLKLGFNNVFGYYIEVSKSNVTHVPADYERRQTLATGERYVTPELKEKERIILTAQERSHSLEYDLFIKVREEVARAGPGVREVAHALAAIDALRSFADAAVANRYVRPEVNDSDSIILKDSRHPVVEKTLSGSFVPNDVHVDTNLNRLIILTGPNMAGKSTYLRQIAHIVIMAQAGSFVPASEAKIGLVDRIFTRVGAFDDLARGQSTFMVEMTELANILNSATKKSLILLDEVGRGTSTFDGLAIAWAVSEHLYDHGKVGGKTLFATHYHHLAELSDTLEGVKNYSMAVREQGSEIVFLRKIVPGRANKSYGIQVAKLAGVPAEVIGRARQVLDRIEEENVLEVKAGKKSHKQALLMSETRDHGGHQVIVDELRSLDLASMSPMEAYLKLNELKKRIGGSNGKNKGA